MENTEPLQVEIVLLNELYYLIQQQLYYIILFNNLKNFDSHLIMQEDKFDFQINVTSNGLENYISFNINNKLMFIDSFQYLSFSLDSSIKNSVRYNFLHFSQ